MSSNRIVRSRSLDSGVTARGLNQVVLPEPGSPMVSTTNPRDGRAALGGSGGTAEGDSGCVSRTSLPSGTGSPAGETFDPALPSAAASLWRATSSRSLPTTGISFPLPLVLMWGFCAAEDCVADGGYSALP